MVIEMTIQVRVSDFEKGLNWYKTLLRKEPDFVPHEGFAEWELIPGSWLQVAEGNPTQGNGPLRLGVTDIESERERVMKELGVELFEVYSREEVPVKWGSFSDPWGNRLGLFEYLDKTEEAKTIKRVLQR
ncbi:VOC family protein [Ferroacidibacillus organovorans]|uniref:Ornithine monooxygenase n=1 Tax=Ferroacidibacillus organovorans TaxID=1765683 RepID=A0A853K7N1_9BACL|nr:VOC family protein [Ferroacidibacillus organovorans]KYP79543.1 ornithine monooxygenase [Ferroacidibacillus organovorans]OAG91134.1 ornithine monooxygenase [Ferroacidibacillus organovorans]